MFGGLGLIEVDVHGMTRMKALNRIDYVIAKAQGSTYRIRIIHGFNSGTIIRNAIREEYPKRSRKVIRVVKGRNPGETELVLKEY